MKIVQINATCGAGSTGKICVAISELLNKKNIENYIFYSSGKSNYPQGIKYTSDIYIKFQALISHIFGEYGFVSKFATNKLICKLKRIKPDIVHLHNIHSHGVNLQLLFTYLKKENIKVYWTFHDCWAFTAYCPHFALCRCNKWQDECTNCVQRKRFSFFFDRSKKLFNKKANLFKELDLTVITPSQWLADLVKQSFLKQYPVKIINNGIDLSVFKPTKSDFREKYNIPNDKKIILGVAFGWGIRKGLDVFCELAKRLDAQKYQIVLVGTNKKIDKILPRNVISIHKTANQQKLAEIYTVADVFLNPTREENYPTVNMESIACGTPVITFNTGGSPECVDETCGVVVDCEDIDKIEEQICSNKTFEIDDCIKKAKQFNMHNRFAEYICLYK